MFAKLWKVAGSCFMPVSMSVCMEQLSSYWMDLHEIWYFSKFWKSDKKIEVSLKLCKNNGYFTWSPVYILYYILLTPFFLEWYVFHTKVVEKNTLFSENDAVKEIIWKSAVEPERPDMTIWRMCISCWVPKATDKHTWNR